MQWADFSDTFLSAGQKTKAAQFEAIGRAVIASRGNQGPKPDISAVTLSQAKAANVKFDELRALTDPAYLGVVYTLDRLLDEARAAFDAANP